MKPRFVPLVCLLGLVAFAWMAPAAPAAETKKPAAKAKKPDAENPLLKANPEVLAKWRAMKFGMFIHWGPVSLKGTEIGWSRGRQVPIEEYDNLYKKFNPVKFDADQWAAVAKQAGMKYMVFTTKHHDGFCMFDTKQTDYNIMNSPFGRDVVKELSEACRKAGLAFGTYYSVCDWHNPDFPHGSPGGKTLKPHPNLDRYEKYLRAQVKELIQNYGPLLVLWFDVSQDFTAERGKGVVEYTRSLQPDILINNRCANPGDFDTPEQHVGRMQTKRPWETCMTICHQWAWRPGDKMKSLKECLQTLIKVVGGDGNLLFNVGPMPDGRIEPRQVERLKEMGQWLAKYGESIYGTRGGPFLRGPWGTSTYKGDTIYVHVLDPALDTIELPAIQKKIVASSVLTGGSATVTQTDESIEIAVPKKDRQEIDTIVVLKLDGPAAEAKPARLASSSVAVGKKAAASNVYQKMTAQYGPDKAVDDDPETRWATDAGTHEAWLEVDLGGPVVIDSAAISEYAPRIRQFELEAKEGDAWMTFYKGGRVHEGELIRFQPVTARAVRLNILKASEGPTIWEFQLFEPRKPKKPKQKKTTAAISPLPFAGEGPGVRAFTHLTDALRGLCFHAVMLCADSPHPNPVPKGEGTSQHVTIDKLDDRCRVKLGGELFCEYVFRGHSRPLVYPIVGPHGVSMTRSWPVKDGVPGESHDHVHQKPMFYAYGKVNGVNFFAEGPQCGKTEQDKLLEIESRSPVGLIRTTNRWVAPDGRVVCTDTRTLRFRRLGAARAIDWEVTLHASQGDVTFADDKHGAMAIRMNPSLRLDNDPKRGVTTANGKAVTSEGTSGKAVFGKRARWIDYWGKVDGHPVGIAIFDHPANPRHPTWWMARGYGYVAADPFGAGSIGGEKPGTGDMTLKSGTSVTFRYRFVFHEGDPKTAGIEALYKQYAAH